MARDGAPRTASAAPGPPRGPDRPSLAFALAMAAPHAAIVVATFLPLVDRLSQATDLPFGVIVVALIQLGGAGLARELDLPVWRRVWLINVGVCAVLLPLLAIQTDASRVPYASREWGAFSPVLWGTIGSVAVVLGLAALAAALAVEEPEEASILYAPVALLVPAVLGAPDDLGEGAALEVLAQASVVAFVACAIGWLLPVGLRPVVGPAALVVQFLLLWVLGYGADFHPTRGDLVPILSSALLAVAIVACVLVPLLAVWLRRVLRAAAWPGER